ncbi:MAG: sulfite exporter TauE/SafE family protein [Halopseudomonas sp.]
MFDLLSIVTIVATFVLAGTVKGVTGLGLPTVSLALLTVAFDMPTAMALLLIPSFATNLWQATVGGHGRSVLIRIWPFLLLATAMVWLGAMALTRADLTILSTLLGVLLITYSVTNLAGFRFQLNQQQQRWAGPLLGAVNGILTGMTGSFVVPGVIYLQAIGLTRDALIQAMGMLFTLSTVALAVSLQGNDLLSVELGTVSALALIPAILGMVLGQAIRKRLSEPLFKRVFFSSLLLLGLYIVIS